MPTPSLSPRCPCSHTQAPRTVRLYEQHRREQTPGANLGRTIVPSIRLSNVAAGTANALDGLQFQDIPEPGALVTIYGSTAVATGTISYSVGTERFLVTAELNVEIVADAVDTNRDMVLDREPVPAGKQFLAVDTQVGNVLVVIEDLPSG